jgi:hypothetical protein
MRIFSKSTLSVFALLCLSMLLTACGGLSAESAKERLLTAEDFDFEVQVLPTKYSKISDIFQPGIFTTQCPEITAFYEDYSRSKIVAESEYQDVSETQFGFTISQYVIQFPNKEDAKRFVENAEKVANTSDCEQTESYTPNDGPGSEPVFFVQDFGNVRDLKSAFNVNVKNSVVFDIDFRANRSESIDPNPEESGLALAASGDLVVVLHYVVVDEISTPSGPVTRKYLENVIGIAFKKMFG